eukprot:1166733-Amphidinium_carterae.1
MATCSLARWIAMPSAAILAGATRCDPVHAVECQLPSPKHHENMHQVWKTNMTEMTLGHIF